MSRWPLPPTLVHEVAIALRLAVAILAGLAIVAMMAAVIAILGEGDAAFRLPLGAGDGDGGGRAEFPACAALRQVVEARRHGQAVEPRWRGNEEAPGAVHPYVLWRRCIEAEGVALPLEVNPGTVAWSTLFPRSGDLRALFGPPAVIAPLPDEWTPYNSGAASPVTFDDRGIHFPEPGIYRLWTRWGALRVPVLPPKASGTEGVSLSVSESATASPGGMVRENTNLPMDRAILLWRFVGGESVHAVDVELRHGPMFRSVAEFLYGHRKVAMYCGDVSTVLAFWLQAVGLSATRAWLWPVAVAQASPRGHLLRASTEASPTPKDGSHSPSPAPGESDAGGHVVTRLVLSEDDCLLDADYGVRLSRGERCLGPVELCQLSLRGAGAFDELAWESLGKWWLDPRFNLDPTSPPLPLRSELRHAPMAASREAYREALAKQCETVWYAADRLAWRVNAPSPSREVMPPQASPPPIAHPSRGPVLPPISPVDR